MKRRYKSAGGILVFLALAITVLTFTLRHTKPCGPAQAVSADAELMKAIVARCYGSADVLELVDVEKPIPRNDEVLVKVQAAAVNPLDWHYMRGSPYFMRLSTGLGLPDDITVGVDFAGTVEAVGANVTKFKPGDEVFGAKGGAFAEYVIVPEDRPMVVKPKDVTFEQAASMPIAATTALQALRDHGEITAGQKVLINGASGGVGTFAVQIAKSFGAEVTGVCSTRNVDMVLSIGADYVVDYKKNNYTKLGKSYDLIVDLVGNHSLSANREVLADTGTLVIVGAPKGDWIAPMMPSLKALVMSPLVDQKLTTMLSAETKGDLEFLAGLVQTEKVNPVIDKRYGLSEVPDAMRYSEEGRARGKIIIEFE